MSFAHRSVVAAIRDARITWLAAAALAAGLAFTSGAARAATTSTTVNVTATVNSVCNMQAASTPIGFGTVPAFLATTQAATGNVTLTCNKGATVTLGVSNGNNFGLGQSGTLRAMLSGTTDYISYHVYQPTGATFSSCAGASTEWTAAISIASLWASTGGPNTISLCGVVDAAPAAGYAVGASYLDVVTVTATYP
jgi:spore coat protein U-like protein